MPFQKMQPTRYPPRLWGLVGFPGSGKTTFAAQMRGPLLVVDADHRFREALSIAALNGREVFQISETPTDSVDPDRIAALLAENMPATRVGTIVIDSLTAIITPLVVQAMVDKDHERIENLAAAWRGKALAMRQLQDAVTRWGTDALWIYHLNDARDAKGQTLTRATISATELVRLTRSINLQLQILQENTRRGIQVVWARRGRSGAILWDETGSWSRMPEKIEAAVYDGLTEAEQEQRAQSFGLPAAPEVFPNAETAIAWGVEQGAFNAIQHARNAYEKLKREGKPQSAREMAALWVAEVERRRTENAGDRASHNNDAASSAAAPALSEAGVAAPMASAKTTKPKQGSQLTQLPLN